MMPFADQFYARAGQVRPIRGQKYHAGITSPSDQQRASTDSFALTARYATSASYQQLNYGKEAASC